MSSATAAAATIPVSSLASHLYTLPSVKIDYDKLDEFEFNPPPECPVYHPTPEEFALGPIEYINKIRPIAEQHGICKIVPPKEFQVPFAIDINEFRFTTRIQRLNELEALTRIKLNFHDRIHKFWDLQGVNLRIPTIEKKLLDLYTFHNVVKDEGGFELCTRDRKWAKIAIKIKCSKSSASFLRSYYEKILFPYDIFQSGATIGPEVKDASFNGATQSMKEMNINGKNVKNEPHHSESEISNNELKKLQVFGAGPRMPGINNEEKVFKSRSCHLCNETNHYSAMLTCNKCEYCFHKSCLIPPVTDTPKGQWHCHRCLSQIIRTLPQLYTIEFGFIQSLKSYTLAEFGEMANKFKSDYFNSPTHEVPYSVVEKEFWRIVSTFEAGACVEYGADLHTNDYGSGFPLTSSKHLHEADKSYINSPWNLNNLPILTGSVFEHINTNIDGVIIPWMYVGMCFSAFCWHNEDHWTYSINYLHWGEPKTWYGVPGDKADDFEDAMRNVAPELFKFQPDLLHQLVTTCNPNLLLPLNVPIYRTNQLAGEFVVTFPRSYHSGFNQGLNFAEAVNFATSDWLPIGRLSIAHYALLHRYPVFSHDELVCRMADDAKDLDFRLASATYDDIIRMIESEKSLRLDSFNMGITDTQRNSFENLQDDERQCDYCKTTCFLSALRCECAQNKLVCLYHYDHLCNDCPPEKMTLIYRYSVDELAIMLKKLNGHINGYNDWSKKVTNLCNANRCEEKAYVDDLIQLKEFAIQKKFNLLSETYLQLKRLIDEAFNYSKVAKNLIKLCNSSTTIDSDTIESDIENIQFISRKKFNDRLKFEDFKLFMDKIRDFSFLIPENEELELVFKKTVQISAKIIKYLKGTNTNLKSSEVKLVVDDANSIKFIDFGFQLEKLNTKYLTLEWCAKYEQFEKSKLTQLSNVDELLAEGLKLPSFSSNIYKKIKHLRTIKEEGSTWIEKVKKALNIDVDRNCDDSFERPSLEFLQALLHWCNNNQKLKNLNLDPYYADLDSVILQANKWNENANKLYFACQKNAFNDNMPTLKTVEEIIEGARKIDCKLEKYNYFTGLIANSKSWIEDLSTLYQNNDLNLYNTIDVILPRVAMKVLSTNFNSRTFYLNLTRKSGQDKKDNLFQLQLKGDLKNCTVENLYKQYVENEKELISNLRINHAKRRKFVEFVSQSSNNNNDNNNIDDCEFFTGKFCFCGKDFSDYLIECQICFDWFHYGCVKVNVNKKSEVKTVINEKELFICCLCSRGKRPRVKEIDLLYTSLKKISVLFIESQVFKFHRQRVHSWQSKVRQEIKKYYLLHSAYAKISRTKADKECKINLNEMEITDEMVEFLEQLLFEGLLLETDLDELGFLWRVYALLRPCRKTVFYFPSGYKRKSIMNSDSIKEKKQKKPSKSSDENWDEFEMCAMKQNCLKPNGDEVQWVLCDKCNEWFHQICQGIVSPTDIENINFFCSGCSEKP